METIVLPASPETWLSPSVVVQLILVAVGIVYTIAALLQWQAIRHQIGITRAIEAPYLSIIFEPKHFPPRLRGDIPYIDYWFVNDGRTPATLGEVAAVVVLEASLPALPTYPKKTTYPSKSVVIGPNHGKSQGGRCPCEMGPALLDKMKDPANQFFFYGYVKYSDTLSIRETTHGFGFRFDQSMNGFIMVEDWPYNYRHYYEKRWYQRLCDRFC